MSNQEIQNNVITFPEIAALVAKVEYEHINKQLTIAKVTLKNGFLLIGTSGKIHPEGFEQAVGERIALNNVYDQIYQLEGYRCYCESYKTIEDRKVT